MLIVTTRHLQAARLCIVPGARDFFKRHNLNFKEFVKHGIDAELLIATGDALALSAVVVAKAEQENAEKNNG
jgi:hypothetical protein